MPSSSHLHLLRRPSTRDRCNSSQRSCSIRRANRKHPCTGHWLERVRLPPIQKGARMCQTHQEQLPLSKASKSSVPASDEPEPYPSKPPSKSWALALATT